MKTVSKFSFGSGSLLHNVKNDKDMLNEMVNQQNDSTWGYVSIQHIFYLRDVKRLSDALSEGQDPEGKRDCRNN